jgi:hypothetical protein
MAIEWNIKAEREQLVAAPGKALVRRAIFKKTPSLLESYWKQNTRSQEIKFILDSLVTPNNDLLVGLLTEFDSGVQPDAGFLLIN